VVARGFGHMRLKDGRIWTLLTTMSELKGHEESVGFDRPMGARHGAERLYAPISNYRTRIRVGLPRMVSVDLIRQ
jgi:hypothetical protein